MIDERRRRVVEPLGILAALAGVRLRAELVHRDRQRLVRLGGDRAVRHRAGREPLDDLAHRFDLVDRNRRPARVELEQTAQGGEVRRLVVDPARVLLEDVVALGAGGVLQLEHRLGVEQVVLTFAPPLVLAAEFELAVRAFLGAARVGDRVAHLDRPRDLVEPDATEAADRAGEVLVDQLVAETDRLEDLGAGVRRDGRHAHLRHDLQHALATRLDVVLDRHVAGRSRQAVQALRDQVLDRLERQIGVDRPGAVADQQRHVVHLAGVTALDDEPDLRALLGADQVMVHRRREQQRRDRRLDRVRVAIAEHDHPGPALDRGRRPPRRSRRVTSRSDSAATGDAIQTLHDVRREAGELSVVVGVDDLRELVVVDDRERQRELPAALGTRIEQVAPRGRSSTTPR